MKLWGSPGTEKILLRQLEQTTVECRRFARTPTARQFKLVVRVEDTRHFAGRLSCCSNGG
jgi:hypothetical protein